MVREENEAFFIRVWKLSLVDCFKNPEEKPKQKNPRGQYLLGVSLDF